LLPLEAFSQQGYVVTAAYINPNIHPYTEYSRRLATFEEYARLKGIAVQQEPYNAEEWEEVVGIHGGPYPLVNNEIDYEHKLFNKQTRCRQCYRLRFEKTSDMAHRWGIESLSTSLTISPYQFTSIIFEELTAAADCYKLNALCVDFRDSYPESVKRSRAMGMYRQNYCGCRFSIEEADMERAALQKMRSGSAHG